MNAMERVARFVEKLCSLPMPCLSSPTTCHSTSLRAHTVTMGSTDNKRWLMCVVLYVGKGRSRPTEDAPLCTQVCLFHGLLGSSEPGLVYAPE